MASGGSRLFHLLHRNPRSSINLDLDRGAFHRAYRNAVAGRCGARHFHALAELAADSLRARRRVVVRRDRLVAAPPQHRSPPQDPEHRPHRKLVDPPVRNLHPAARHRGWQRLFRPPCSGADPGPSRGAARRAAYMSPLAGGVERSLTGQPWRWRRSGGDDLGRDLVDQLLLARGIEESDLARHRAPTIRDFLPNPSEFKDMDKAAKRLADAVERAETVAIFGDYDVDGATSAALLAILLRRLGVEPIIYIPDRLMEGYGPSGAALVELKRRGWGSRRTAATGARAFYTFQAAADAGLDVLVVDHHQCATSLPTAFA